MIKRDKCIIDTIEKFRVCSRDHIAELFFSHTKNPITNANYTLKRLTDRGYIISYKNQRLMNQNLYFPAGTKIKKDGQKIGQYLHIFDVYIDLLKNGEVKEIDIEPRYNLIEIRPDIYCMWKGSMWFIECQNTRFNDKQMNEKIERYEQLYLSEQYKELPFQKYDKKYMPFVLIVGESIPYNIQSSYLKIFQSKSISEFMSQFKQENSNEHQKQPQNNKAINNVNNVVTFKDNNGETKVLIK